MNRSNLTRRAVTTDIAAIACGFTVGLSFANDSTPIKIAVGFPPGGSGDLFARILAAARQHCSTAQLEGAIVAPMRERGIELFVGYSRDPQWGPILAVGLGDVWVEVLQDVALRPSPVDADEVKRMLGGLRGAKLLAGQRGVPAADLDAVASAIAQSGEAILHLDPELEEFDVNPLWVRDSQVEALDALFVWRSTEVAAQRVAAH